MNKLYHVTRLSSLASILRKGLKAKKPKDMDDEMAVYCFKNRVDAEDALMNWLGDRFEDDEELVLIEIDASFVKKTSPNAASYEVAVKHDLPRESILGYSSI